MYGRLITDNIISTYECLHFMKWNIAKKNRLCALKLDMMKAYDVDWTHLRAIMTKLGFCSRWIYIIMGMLSSVSISVMLNGKKWSLLNLRDVSVKVIQYHPISCW